MSMPFSVVAECYEKLEAISGRIEMTELLANLLRKTPAQDIDKVCYLTLGKIAPDFSGIELGIGEKLALKAIAMASGQPEKMIKEEFNKIGDIGNLAEWAISRKSTLLGFEEELTVEGVFSRLMRIATASGPKSQDVKLRTLAGLMADASGREARYIARIVTGKLRLGIGDMTLLDAMAEIYLGSRARREEIERKYNIYPDVGRIAKALAEKGEEGLKEIDITLGVPIRAMLAQRVKSLEEVFERMGDTFLAEYKYDGERMQVHIWPDKRVRIYSRRLEDITHPYPDIIAGVKEAFKGKEAILDGECVAINVDTGEILPFQQLMHRRRKYGVEEILERIPTMLFFFDILYLDGKSLIDLPLQERHSILESVIKENEKVQLAKGKVMKRDPKSLEEYLNEAVSNGTEGLMIKDLNSPYEAGARGWTWIKLKRSYISKMVEPVDLVAVGAFWGRGKRAGTYGALLLAAYNHEKDLFETVCKMGTGFTDEELARLPELFKDFVISHKHPRVVSEIEADVWFTPAKVLEVIGDEITLSPTHTCAKGVIEEGSGLAIRFPRFTGKWRDEKSPQDATTVKEIVEMYKAQLAEIKEK